MNQQTKPATGSAGSYSIQEVSELLGLSLNQTYKEASKGMIPHLRFGKRYVFPKIAIDRWMAEAGENRTAA